MIEEQETTRIINSNTIYPSSLRAGDWDNPRLPSTLIHDLHMLMSKAMSSISLISAMSYKITSPQNFFKACLYLSLNPLMSKVMSSISLISAMSYKITSSQNFFGACLYLSLNPTHGLRRSWLMDGFSSLRCSNDCYRVSGFPSNKSKWKKGITSLKSGNSWLDYILHVTIMIGKLNK